MSRIGGPNCCCPHACPVLVLMSHNNQFGFIFTLRSQEVVCGFISEALAGRNTVVHTVYYETDDDDGMITIPGQYADRGQTADYLRQMAHVTNGRFHWFRNGGENWFG